MDIEQARFNMIEQQIRPWDVLDPQVLSLLAVVKREDFVPPAYRSMAFMDMEVPLPDGQCMLAPRVEARLLQELQLQRHEHVLEVGAGSGFMAALLAFAHGRSRPGVVGNAGAHGRAQPAQRRRDERLVRRADGAQGYRGDAPFDAIVLSGSVAVVPPRCWNS